MTDIHSVHSLVFSILRGCLAGWCLIPISVGAAACQTAEQAKLREYLQKAMVGAPKIPAPIDVKTTRDLPAGWNVGAAQLAVPPRVTVDTAFPDIKRSLRVRVGQSIQKAVDSARRGDEIVLEKGGIWVESVVLRARPGEGWIVIRTDLPLPGGGLRIPFEIVGDFAKILAPANGTHAVRTEANADGWRLVGLEISAGPEVTSLNSLLRLGDPYATTVSAQPKGIILDRMYIHGTPLLPLTRCVELHTRDAAVIHSIVSECHTKGSDSQAILGYNGPGPFLIANNYLAGAGENIMFGGSTPAIRDLIPCDIHIVGNHIHKPLEWRNVWLSKNLVEIKLGCRILAERNLLENVWLSGQVGYAVVLKSSGGSKAPWTEARDITFRSNVIRNAAFGGFALAAAPEKAPAVPMSRVTIVDNLIYKLGKDSDFANKGGRGITALGGVAHVLIAFNTIAAPELPIALYRDGNPPPVPGFTLRGNVLQRGTYGLWGSGPEGTETVRTRYSSHLLEDNVFFGGAWPKGRYPSSNYFVAQPASLFENFGAWNLKLAPGPARNRGPNGAEPGSSVHLPFNNLR